MTTLDLFADDPPWSEELCDGATLHHGFALGSQKQIQTALEEIVSQAPFRHMTTPGGHRMSVAMTNCGNCGWVSGRKGYQYSSEDPESGRPWPSMPAVFSQLSSSAAAAAGFPDFCADACLINHYQPGAKMSLHQDKNERDFAQPIVSISLGLPAVFLLGGFERTDKTRRIPLRHGDVLVWGGQSRLRYHGILALKDGEHDALGRCRVNLTLRKAR